MVNEHGVDWVSLWEHKVAEGTCTGSMLRAISGAGELAERYEGVSAVISLSAG